MITPRFEKFEMKYGYSLPDEYKAFMLKYGGDSHFGSCRFDYADNIINNLLRVPGKMDFQLVPFGDIGNGDYYCFYRYGAMKNEYYIGIWLHETRNFVILASSFRSFMYKCLLDDYLTIVTSDEFDNDEITSDECIERGKIISEEFGFDLETVKNMKDEFDYHKLMINQDKYALQSLSFVGKRLLEEGNPEGYKYLNRVMEAFDYYTAPYYVSAKAEMRTGSSGMDHFKKGLKTSLVFTGYSYWEEDFIEIPEDIHREIALFCDEALADTSDYLEKRIYQGEDPYSYQFRLDLARYYESLGDIDKAIMEYSNALFCVEDSPTKKEILKLALEFCKNNCIYYLTKLIEQDIKNIR